MKNGKYFSLIALVAIAIMVVSCKPKQQNEWLEHGIERASAQLKAAAVKFEADTIFPRSIKDGQYKIVGPHDWTSGFFPGTLWYAYELTGDEQLKNFAQVYTNKLYDIQYFKGTHDLGFMMFCSYGNQQRLLGDTLSPKVLHESAESLVSRIDPNIGLIRSWDFGSWNYPVIIDNMMNLEMLYWVSKTTGDKKYSDAATVHADKTLEHHFRDDNSSYHVISYNNDGTVESKGTFQGYCDSSSWARGQAWGLYGYTMCFRETQLERYKEHAQKIAKLIMTLPSMPSDLIPYWDYNAPDIPNAPRDASAASVTASALLELSTMTTGEESKSYFDYAEKILKSLSSDAYLAPLGENGDFVLMHSTGHLPANSEIDTPLNYADYYYLEAAKRYLDLQKKNL